MQDILVRATRFDLWEPAVQGATRIAAAFDAALTAVYVVPAVLPPPASAYDGGAMVAEYALELQREADEAQARAPAFVEWAAAQGVRHAQWIGCTADVADGLAYAGNWHDLLVLPLDDGAQDPWSGPNGVARTILDSGMPTLVLPRGADWPDRCSTIVVAWNGSVEAIRALHAARPFLRHAERAVLLLGDRGERLDPMPAFALEEWCARHAVRVEYEPLDPHAEGEDLLQAARAARADLLVMGAFGRSRFAEWVLGGVTRHMLLHADLPLLMRH